MQTSTRYFFRLAVGILITIASGIYLYTQLESFILGPSVNINYPSEISSISKEESIIVAGTAENIDNITLNGKKIVINQYNEWDSTLLLAKGLNIIEIMAHDRFNRTYKEVRYVVYEPVELRKENQSSTTKSMTQ